GDRTGRRRSESDSVRGWQPHRRSDATSAPCQRKSANAADIWRPPRRLSRRDLRLYPGADLGPALRRHPLAAMLFGRSAERAQLEQLLDAVPSGAVGCVVEGTAGIGKTTLWRESVASARNRGYRVLETAPSEPESMLAFSGLGDLFEWLPDEVLATLPE